MFMFMAFLFLPMVVISPQKFVLLFTLGCLSWITGLGTLQGAGALAAAMMQRERLPFSVGYLASLIGTIYATMIAHSYLLTILFAGFELVTLGAFIISYFPGGIRVLGVIKGVIVDRAMTWMGRAPQAILPI
ncbi:SFT2 protein [Gregarina niphandrodes]|uniref:Vesicle transport protein n=1 Tax=Gregarina niphandrodes TaxID=110365 RepID=A0A023BA80_GRENI|nr:SFT2 protein [Gregarina niphandrodes]EZG78151.1 SFT2 protein [Gregarina niphandrodes]|eukprot:XP_011129437.1 SFT2 protein [Gregarina niphandrodes]